MPTSSTRISGYGALQHQISGTSGTLRSSHQHMAAQKEDLNTTARSRNGARVACVAAVMLLALIVVAALALANPPASLGNATDLAIPKFGLQAADRVELMSPHFPGVRVQSQRKEMLQAAGGGGEEEGLLNPLPYWKYNLFEPDDPRRPHHRWTADQLREEAERLVLLAQEAKAWEDEKYRKEVLMAQNMSTTSGEDLGNISAIEAEAKRHMAVIAAGMETAEGHIDRAEKLTHDLQEFTDYKLDKTRRAVWLLISEHGKDLDFNAMVQAYIDRQAEMDMKADGELNTVKINRYTKELEQSKQTMHEMLEKIRGRIATNLTAIREQDRRVQHEYEKYKAAEDGDMQQSYAKATQLGSQIGKDVRKAANIEVRNRQIDAKVQAAQAVMNAAFDSAQKTSIGVENLDNLMMNQHIEDEKKMVAIMEKYESLKSRMSMLITSLTTVQGTLHEVQEAHSALKQEEDVEMKKLKDAVENLKPKLQSILDLDSVVKDLQSSSQSSADEAMERFKNVKSAQDKLGEDNNDLKEKLDLLSNAIGDQEKFVQSNGYMSSYADIENMLHPVSMQIDEVKGMHDMLDKTSDDIQTWSAALLGQVSMMHQERAEWKDLSAKAADNLKAKVNSTIEEEMTGMASMFSAIKAVRDKIEEVKNFKESSLALHNELKQQLAETTQDLETMDTKFSDLYNALRVEVEKLSNETEGVASPEDINVAEDRVHLAGQQVYDSSTDLQPQVDYAKEQQASERARLDKMENDLSQVQTEIDNAIKRAKEMLRRHPNLFERISCVCYDGDKLTGTCIAGSLDDESTCEPCPAGSYCLRGEEYPCKTRCWSGMVLTGTCPVGSVTDITTCDPCPEGFWCKSGKATECISTCDPGFELRGSCPIGSSDDTKRCVNCPAGFFCENGEAKECKTSCEAGLVLAGKCREGSTSDTITCEPSPAGFYSEVGVAIPCKQSCEDGKYIIDECPEGSSIDTSTCTECPEGFFCTGGKKYPCKVTCENGEELTGSCPAGSAFDVTVCMRCPEGNYCTEGKAFPCKSTCDDGLFLQGRCRKGSTEDTTKCRKCKSNFFCTNGTAIPCRQECDKGFTLEGSCPRGSVTDTTECKPCPEDFYCEATGLGYSRVTECKKRCWEGKLLQGKCLEGSYEDTTTCDECPAGSYCKAGIAYECKTGCDDGFVFSGQCPAGSVADTTICSPCPKGSFCKDGNVKPCKTTCEDGLLLQGFCRAGSKSDKTECVPCPDGSFCVDGKAQECVHSCPNGQTLVGTCEGSSFTHCEPCPEGFFCRNDKKEECKTTCPVGQYLEGSCDEGSSKDKTMCRDCAEGSFCIDGKISPCKETCPAGQQLNGRCKAGSSEDVTSCDPCPAGSFCMDGIASLCQTSSSCALGQQFVGECAAGSETDVTSCEPCPPGSYCRNGLARPCRTNIDCGDGHKIDGTCPEGSDMNPVCKPCRAGVFCVGGDETPCRATCDPGMVLQGFCTAGSPTDTTQCTSVQAGSYAVDGVAVPCRATCEDGQLLTGSCPEGGSEDGMVCTTCPEGSWCRDGIAMPCTTECPNGKLLSGTCPENSKSDTVGCDPCPAGSFCADGVVKPCKTECPDGKLLDGECPAGSAEDTTHCASCPSGFFCKEGAQSKCTSTCPDGQVLDGFCAAGSTEDTVQCVTCPAGSFCTGGVATPCKTTCDDGEEFRGTCAEGSGTDTTTCDICPTGFYCQDGLKAPCKTSCPIDTELKGDCSAGSVTDTVYCFYDGTPKPMMINWWNDRSVSENVHQDAEGRKTASLGDEIRLTAPVGTPGFIEGRYKLPLPGAKWNIQFYAFWPDYDAKAAKDGIGNTYPIQGYGKQAIDSITATINGQVISMEKPLKEPGVAYFDVDSVADEVVWRFDFTSQTPEVKARPFIVAGEVTIVHDSTTGDQGAGAGSGRGKLAGYVLNAIDGRKIRPPKPATDGIDRKGIPVDSDARLLLFKKSKLIMQAPVKSAKFKFNIEDGEYTCVAMLKGFMAFYDQECIIAGNKLKKNVVFSPFVAPGQMRVVLTWGEAVKDLDSYMLVPHAEVTDPPCEANWKNKECSSGAVHLDQDAKSGFGPETITLDSLRAGRYRFRVSEYHGFSDNRDRLVMSEAQVALYTATGVTVYRVDQAGSEAEPTGAGFLKGESWYVFIIDGATGKAYPCSGDVCGHGYHHHDNRGRLR